MISLKFDTRSPEWEAGRDRMQLFCRTLKKLIKNPLETIRLGSFSSHDYLVLTGI